MATVVNKKGRRNNAADFFGSFLESGYKSYTQKSDERALQSAIEGLGENPSARQILDAVTKTNTYSPQAKQNLLQNYMGVSQFEELQKQHREQTEINKVKNEIEQYKTTQKQGEEVQKRNNIKSIVNQLDLPEDKKQELGESLSQEAAESLLKEKINPKKSASSVKEEEKIDAMEVGIDTIDQMLSIGKRNNLGRGSNITSAFGGEAAFDYGRYEQLGKSLIQLATSIPIRNRQEFETLSHGLFDPTIPDKQREGKLTALKDFLQRTLKKSAERDQEKEPERPPLSSFERK